MPFRGTVNTIRLNGCSVNRLVSQSDLKQLSNKSGVFIEQRILQPGPLLAEPYSQLTSCDRSHLQV